MNANTNMMTFQGVSIKPLHRDGQVWIRLPEIGAALGYVDGTKALNNIFNRHADEFTDSLTRLVKLGTAGGKQLVRIFSLRGAHLLAMFARTDVAKAFRVWVLDILEREVSSGPTAANSRYHFPLSSCKPMPKHDGFDHQAQFDLTTLSDPCNPRPELDLLRQLERDGHDVTGARVRIIALYCQLQHAVMERDRMEVWKNRLKDTIVEIGNYQHESGPGALFCKTPQGIEKLAFDAQLPNWKI